MRAVTDSCIEEGVHLLVQHNYKPGDPAPEGYLAWHEWAEIQAKSGLRQQQCGFCMRWWFPQQLTGLVLKSILQSRRGPVAVESAVCLACARRKGMQDPAGRTTVSTTAGSNGVEL